LYGAEVQTGLPVRMAVDARWWAVGRPSGVCDTRMRVEDLGEIWLLILDELLQFGNLANLLECEDLVLLVTIDCNTGGVISSVFQSRETIDESVEDILPVFLHQVVYVTKDAAVVAVS
jgi:hypothetical protein